MNLVYNKLIGYLLLITGLAMIFWSVNSAYEIFNGRKIAPEIFKIESKEISDAPEKTNFNSNIQNEAEIKAEMQNAIGNEIGNQLKNMLPIDYLPKIMNMASWSFFVGILIFAGSHVSGLGIKMIKD